MKISLFGDSFSVPKHNDQYDSWVSLLSKEHNIINHSECGVGEYKILKQIQNATEYSDLSIVTHTSPFRIYAEHNPLHAESEYHKNCDVIFSDVEPHEDSFSTACKQYFKYLFNEHHCIDMHTLVLKEIETLLPNAIHITHFDYTGLYKPAGLIEMYNTWILNKGTVCHYNEQGNYTVYKEICNAIQDTQTRRSL